MRTLESQNNVEQFPTYRKILNLERTYLAMEAAFETALSYSGLSTAQWGILRLLREHPGASGAEIARFAKITPQAVATMLQRLEKAQLITRQAATSGRVVETYVTAQGEELLQKGDRVAAQLESQIFADFSAEEQARFNEYLLRCVANLEPPDHESI